MTLFFQTNTNEIPYTYLAMLIPSASAIIAIFLCQKNIPCKSFYFFYIITISLLSCLMISMNFLPFKNIGNTCDMFIIYTSIIGYLILLQTPEDERFKGGFAWINGKKSIFCIFLFIILFIIMTHLKNAINFLITQRDFHLIFARAAWERFPMMLLSFFLTYIIYFGEEYGWRYFLQSKLTQKYGLIKSLSIVGITWSVFHFPTDFIYHQASIVDLVSRFSVCITLSYFLGCVYEYTHNIWTVTFIHFLYNCFLTLWPLPENGSQFAILSYWLVFLPFALIFKKSLSK